MIVDPATGHRLLFIETGDVLQEIVCTLASSRSRRRWLVLGLVLCTMSLVAGCATENAAAPPSEDPVLADGTYIANAEGLANAPGSLTSAERVELIVVEDASGLAWKVGCNQMSGSLQVRQRKLAVRAQSWTEQGCTRTETKQDRSLTSFLESGPTWELHGNVLTLKTNAGTIQLEQV